MTPEQIKFRAQQWLNDREEPDFRWPTFLLLIAEQDTFGPVDPVTSVQPALVTPGPTLLQAYKMRRIGFRG